MKDLIQHAEDELRESRTLCQSTCESFTRLPKMKASAYSGALTFVCGNFKELPSEQRIYPLELDRIKAARLMLLKLELDSSNPKWSSWMLDRLLEVVFSTPGGNLSDLFQALFGLLEDYSCELSKSVAALLKDLVINCFSRYRKIYESTDWAWMAKKVVENPTSAQAYLALHALRLDTLKPKHLVSMLRSLERTPYWKYALIMMSDDLENTEAQKLLKELMTNEIDPLHKKDIEHILIA